MLAIGLHLFSQVPFLEPVRLHFFCLSRWPSPSSAWRLARAILVTRLTWTAQQPRFTGQMPEYPMVQQSSCQWAGEARFDQVAPRVWLAVCSWHVI